jgi:hypothetical protein
MIRTSIVLISLALVACGDDSAPTVDAGGAGDAGNELCRAGVMEPDANVLPFAGRGVAEGGALMPFTGEVHVSTTYVRIDPDANMRFQELSGAVIADAQSRPGLLALGLEISAGCGSARTLTVWESMDAMLQFVVAPAHAQAMTEATDVSLAGSTVVHWTTSDVAEASWDEAVERAGSAPPLAIYE